MGPAALILVNDHPSLASLIVGSWESLGTLGIEIVELASLGLTITPTSCLASSGTVADSSSSSSSSRI